MHNDESTESLLCRIERTLRRTDNSFYLFFVLVNQPEARKEIAHQLIKQLQRPVIELSASPETLQDTTLDGWLLPQLKTASKDSVVFLYNLQEILPTEKKALLHTLQQLNWRRSSLAAIQRPLVIWLPRYAIDNLAEYAPDFYDWYSNVYEFIPSTEELRREYSRFITEFHENGVHPADRLNTTEKQEWLRTLTSLLAENPARNTFRAQLLNDSGRLHFAIGHLDDALELYGESLEISQQIGNKAGEGDTLHNISQIYDARGDYNTALSCLKKSLKIAEKIRDKAGEGRTLNNISQIYNAQGNYDTALSCLNKSLEIQREIGDKAGEGATLNNISQIYHDRGDHDTALSYLKKSLEIRQETGDKAGEGTTLNNISQIYEARGDYDTALSYLNKSLNIHQKMGNKAGEGAILNNISQIYHDRGDYDTALSLLEKSLKIRQETGNKAGEGKALNNISQIYNARGDHDTALSYLNKSLKIMQETGDAFGICVTLFNIGDIHWQNEENQKAIETWVQVYLLAKQLNNAEVLQALEGLAGKVDLDDGLAGWQRLAEKIQHKEITDNG